MVKVLFKYPWFSGRWHSQNALIRQLASRISGTWAGTMALPAHHRGHHAFVLIRACQFIHAGVAVGLPFGLEINQVVAMGCFPVNVVLSFYPAGRWTKLQVNDGLPGVLLPLTQTLLQTLHADGQNQVVFSMPPTKQVMPLKKGTDGVGLHPTVSRLVQGFLQSFPVMVLTPRGWRCRQQHVRLPTTCLRVFQ